MFYKVVATVHKVSEPEALIPGETPHVVMPCRMYEVGDKIVFQDNQLDMSETTGALCLSLLGSMIPVMKALQRSVEPILDPEAGETVSDSTQKVTFFSCPDAERPVIFRIERIPIDNPKPAWVIAEEYAVKNPGKSPHWHLPNPNDRLRGVHNNMGDSTGN